MTRREFAASLSATALSAQSSGPARFSKGICAGIFPKNMPLSEAFLQAKNAGFDGIEIPVGGEVGLNSSPDDVRRVADAAQKAQVEIVSLWASPLGQMPLNDDDPAVRAKGVEAVKKCLDIAKALNCGAMLMVPGGLGYGSRMKVGYMDTWDRITPEMRKLIPHAEKCKVIMTPENVWNKFLVSPRDMRDFVDQFKSPWVGTHFDVGNIMQFGFPQDWILTLGQRIKRVHLKDYKLSTRAEQGHFVPLMEGDVDWKAVMNALTKVGYRGYLSPEIGYDASNPDQLKQVSATVDKILALA